jgi:hypothetical protein
MKNQSPVSSNLPVKELSLEKMKKHTEGDQDYPHNGFLAYKPLPNVRKFRVEVSNYDRIFAAFGIQKRLAPKMKFEYHTNGSLNRYVDKQFERMSDCAKTDPIKC